jgi:hypothetical protein
LDIELKHIQGKNEKNFIEIQFKLRPMERNLIGPELSTTPIKCLGQLGFLMPIHFHSNFVYCDLKNGKTRFAFWYANAPTEGFAHKTEGPDNLSD